ncbi:hypothetical protein Poli38472_006638 [Pythium oligandrum]|uniref:Major facilitator superfamily (MFS) profile domain-containing protein n=1 Tax=Pythium oligandrum TaxID=41045 RepID=A0A8K1C571_PYTOL|nr:hypothetical protein Poli38472_006638 [Pythium oligandrum]|eukprot:TMW56628.1 hypothetical protein Poli38472_006638 [Pythium oligandrum]
MQTPPSRRRAPSTDADGQPEPPSSQPDSPSPAQMPVPATYRRYGIALLCLWITTICYADRTNIGIAISAFVDTKDEQGQVLSAFFYGYLLTQIPGGYLAARFGAKRVLLTGVVVWTLFDLMTVLVSQCLPCLFLARIGMGIGEGILFPCMHQISGAWYPLQERSRLVSFVSGGSDLGTITALIVSPAIMAAYGWPRIFEFFAILSFMWVFAYTIYGESHPEDDPHISAEERAFILANRTTVSKMKVYAATSSNDEEERIHDKKDHGFNWRVLLTSRAAWAVYVAHFASNYGWYVLLGWIPQYFRQELHIDLGTKGFTAAIPYVCGYIGLLIFGRLGDLLVARGYRVLQVRQAINGLGFFSSAFFLFMLRYASGVYSAVFLLSLTLFFGRAALAGFWVNMIDIGPKNAAHVMAVSNTFATLPGIIGNVVTGRILAATGEWDLVFAIAGGVLIFGGVFFHCNASDQSIYADKKKKNQRNVEMEDGISASSTEISNMSSLRDDEASLLRE